MTDTAVRFGPSAVANSEGTLYTAPAATTTIVKWLRITNTTGTPATIRMSIGADAAGTRLLSDVPIPANDFLELDDFLVLDAAQTLRATGGTNNALTVTGGAVEVSDLPAAPLALPQVVHRRILQSDFVAAGPNGVIDPFYTLPADVVLTAASIFMTVPFDDSSDTDLDIDFADDTQFMVRSTPSASDAEFSPGIFGLEAAQVSIGDLPYRITTPQPLNCRLWAWADDGAKAGIADLYLTLHPAVP